jgi:hypothetical protein
MVLTFGCPTSALGEFRCRIFLARPAERFRGLPERHREPLYMLKGSGPPCMPTGSGRASGSTATVTSARKPAISEPFSCTCRSSPLQLITKKLLTFSTLSDMVNNGPGYVMPITKFHFAAPLRGQRTLFTAKRHGRILTITIMQAQRIVTGG